MTISRINDRECEEKGYDRRCRGPNLNPLLSELKLDTVLICQPFR